MHIILVIIHVSLMISSMVLMASAVGIGLAGKSVAARIASIGYVSTVVGSLSGGILLLSAILTAYLLGITLLYHFGFAFGDATNARLIRTRS
jgi:hypothetical protein